ncbi:MAG: hypothetical protein AB8H79_07165, partial [Myxococcota bacterium]
RPRTADGEYAASHVVCAECHTATDQAVALKDASGRSVGPADLWPGSMMAHAARDPIFRASVAIEAQAAGADADAVEAECLRCHAPAAWAEHTLAGVDPPSLSTLSDSGVFSDLARDGANCMGCHLQRAEDLGSEASFSGQLNVNDQRLLFGPHRLPLVGPMRNVARFTPTESSHVQRGELCASCHTLQTHAVDGSGALTGDVVTEQGTFLEWRSSAYNPEFGQESAATCQACHMPVVDPDGVSIRARIARDPNGADFTRTYAREPVARHLLYGGNTFVLSLIRDHRDLLGSPASDAQLQASIEGTRAFLNTAATVDVGAGMWVGDRVHVPIRVNNHTGHKLPTGYPSRRVWLAVEIVDGLGKTVFSSGATDARGQIVDGQGQPLASERDGGPVEAHRDRVGEDSGPIIWQSWLEDSDGMPTELLRRGARYAKDNRILPTGWAPSDGDAAKLAPVGVAEDPTFIAGSDTVTLDVGLADEGPYILHVELLYQSFSPRFLGKVTASELPEARAVSAMIQARSPTVEVLHQTSITLPAR